VKFEITSVVPLNVEQETNLIKELKSLSAANEVKLTIKQDPSILGGLLVQSGSQFIDLSINGELRSISNYLGSNFEF
jgi:F-type H+-transporting ATPase subunit delta